MSKIISDSNIEIPPPVFSEHLVDKRGSVKTHKRGGREGLVGPGFGEGVT